MRNTFCFLLSILLITVYAACDGPHLSDDAILLKNISIINPYEGSVAGAQTILIENGIITRIIPAGSIAYAAPFEVDATGLFAVPGFAEADFDLKLQAETAGPELTRLLAGGITTLIVSSKNVNPAISELKQEIKEGVHPGPEIVFAARVVPEKNTASGDDNAYMLPADPAGITSFIENLKAAGTDIIFIPSDPEYERQTAALKAEAEAAGLAVSAEEPHGYRLNEALDSPGAPSEVLQSMYLLYSHYPVLKEKSGAVSARQPANIAVLSGNPAENLQFLDSVQLIVHNGRLFTADSLRGGPAAEF